MSTAAITSAEFRYNGQVRVVALAGLVANVVSTALQVYADPASAWLTLLTSALVTIVALGVVVFTYLDWHVRRVARLGLYLVTLVLLTFLFLRGGMGGFYAPTITVMPALSVLLLSGRDVIVYGVFFVTALIGVTVADPWIARVVLSPERDTLVRSWVLLTVVICNFLVLAYLARSNERYASRLSTLLRQQTHAARHDDLTGLANRTRVNEVLATLQAEGARLALFLIDLDGFKEVNDRAGHATGDRVLSEVAQSLAAAAVDGELVARLGGDEFLVVAPLGPDFGPGDVPRMGERLVAAIRSTDPVASGLSGSVGSACYPRDGATVSEALSRADEALYLAKRQGRGRHMAYPGPETARRGDPDGP